MAKNEDYLMAFRNWLEVINENVRYGIGIGIAHTILLVLILWRIW